MERFVNDILAECPGAPGVVIKKKVLRAAIRFCEDSWAWREKVLIDIAPGDIEASIFVFSDATIVGVVSTLVGTRPFTGFNRSLDLLTFDEPASQAFTLDVEVAIKPVRTTTMLEDVFIDDWYDGIEAGAKSALMIMQGKPWFNPPLADFYRREFKDFIVEHRIRNIWKNDTSTLRVQPRRFV